MTVKLERTTKETVISLELLPEGGEVRVTVSCGFLRHMFVLFAFHAGMGLVAEARRR